MQKGRRRSSKLSERVTPCICCNHFLSHRHHLLPFASFGENNVTIQLCANCHEIYHLVEKVYTLHQEHKKDFDKLIQKPKTRSLQTYTNVIWQLDNQKVKFFSALIEEADALSVYTQDDGSVLAEDIEDFNECIDSLNAIIRDWMEKNSGQEREAVQN